MPSTMPFEFGQIVLVRFPFTDQHGAKQRPAVVISSDAYNRARPDVILMAVTSRMRTKPSFGDAVIADWQAAGLLKPSAIKPIVVTAEKTIVSKTLGRLGDEDQQRLRDVSEAVVG